jgi:hypothetical protein
MYTDFVFDLRYWLKPHKLLAVTVHLLLPAIVNTRATTVRKAAIHILRCSMMIGRLFNPPALT